LSHSSVIVLMEMLESIDKIIKYVAGMSSIDFLASSAVQDAVLHRLMIIGEATKQIPENLRQQYREISWCQMAGLRIYTHWLSADDTQGRFEVTDARGKHLG